MTINFQKGEIRYRLVGQGPCIVLLHGFLGSSKVWNKYAEKLSSKFTVLSIDLPGHGKSTVSAEVFPMNLMAEAVKAVLDHLKIEKATLVGHSMGGYVSLAFAQLFPNVVTGLTLMNSTALPDSAERKKERERAIKLAEGHKLKYITAVVPNWFFERTGQKANKRILKMVKIAAKTSKEGIQASLKGMRDRKDLTSVLAKATFPIQIIAGKNDFVIPLEQAQQLAALNPKTRLDVLNECGHIGFLEAKDECFKALQAFALENFL